MTVELGSHGLVELLMNIAIFGLGYVGAVTAGCLTRQGHRVIGVDAQESKVRALQDGRSPIVEAGLEELLSASLAEGRLEATLDAAQAVAAADLSLVCVGTPALASGRLNLEAVRHVSSQIRDALRQQPRKHTLVYRCRCCLAALVK